MRRLIPVLALLLILVACGGDDDDSADAQSDVAPTATETPEPPAPTATSEASTATATPEPPADTQSDVGELVELGHGITITLHEIQFPAENPNFADQLQGGQRVLGLDIELCAGPDMPDGPLTAEPFDFSSRMPDNTRQNTDLGKLDPQFIRSDLTAGECNRGWVTFIYEENERPDLFTYDLTYAGETYNVRWPYSD